MKTHKLLVTVALLLVLSTTTSAQRSRIAVEVDYRPQTELEVYVWPDRGIDATYYPREPISVFFEVTRDCYVVIYDLDTRGRLHILFPFDPGQDNFVRAGRVYELPGDWDSFRLTVEGPAGTEYIQAIASPDPFDLPDWPIYLNSPGRYPVVCSDPELLDFRAGADRLDYIYRVNRKISRHAWDWCATDLARFYVRRRPLRPLHINAHYDPWPDVFYGEFYVGWPVGARIYVDGIYFGLAPCWVRGLSYGYHRVQCYDGRRLLRDKQVRYRHKRRLRHDHPDYRLSGRYRGKPYRAASGEGPVLRDRSILRRQAPQQRSGKITRTKRSEVKPHDQRRPASRKHQGKISREIADKRGVRMGSATSKVGKNLRKKEQRHSILNLAGSIGYLVAKAVRDPERSARVGSGGEKRGERSSIDKRSDGNRRRQTKSKDDSAKGKNKLRAKASKRR